MWTVCWTSPEGKDSWERFDTLEGMLAMLDEFALMDDEDVLIFTPEADGFVIIPAEIEEYEREWGTAI